MRISIILLMGLVLVSCSESGTDQSTTSSLETPSAVVKQDAMVSLDLSAFGPLLEIKVPDKRTQGVDPSVGIDELSGYISIHAGKNFQMVLREEPTTLGDIRQELENEMMWKNTITPVEEHSIIIERALPDGSMAQHHFASVLPGAGGNIIVRSNPMGEFSKKDVDRMLKSALTLKTETGLALTSH